MKIKILIENGKLHKKIINRNDISKKIELFKKYVFYFGKEGFKNYIFGKKLKLIELTVNDFLKKTKVLMKVELSGMTKLKSGKYNQKITGHVYINGRKRNYNNLSKGERKRIDLAFILALGKLLNFKNDINLRIFDEPFGGLDEKGMENIVLMLKNIGYNTYIVSPKKDIATYFNKDEIKTVIKENGISKIEREKTND